MRSRLIPLALMFAVIIPALSLAQEIDCLKCHARLKSEKTVHPALDMGCPTCHTGIDARSVPHKKTIKIGKGLSSEQPGLCYGCHDKAAFGKANVHAAVGMGCTSCHNPHSSKNAKLLVSEAPDLCYNCHDKEAFTKKVVHSPVEGGMCLSCHSPHSSDQTALLLKKPAEVCLECHPDVSKKPHAIAVGHPLGLPVVRKIKNKQTGKIEEKIEVRDVKDPARQGKQFYCGSCHNPHSSASPRLYRYPVRSAMELCSNCHKY